MPVHLEPLHDPTQCEYTFVPLRYACVIGNDVRSWTSTVTDYMPPYRASYRVADLNDAVAKALRLFSCDILPPPFSIYVFSLENGAYATIALHSSRFHIHIP